MCTMHAILTICALCLFTQNVQCQFPFSFAPDLPVAIKDTAVGVQMFLDLWEFSLEVDKTSAKPVPRKSLVPKTLIVPEDIAMIQLIPQDATNPLYYEDKKNSDLRREFILNHLILEPISPTDPQVSSEEGVTATTLSGRSVLIKMNDKGVLTVEDVRVMDVMKLADDTLVYRLEAPLFNLKKKVKQAFNKLHKIDVFEPVGPPLIIPRKKAQEKDFGQPPSPPPARTVEFEQPETNNILPRTKSASEGEPMPPAPPPDAIETIFDEPQPPAPPPVSLETIFDEPQPPALPVNS